MMTQVLLVKVELLPMRPANPYVIAILCLIFLGLSFDPSQGATTKRLALVIGNGAYQFAPTLSNPPNDATIIAESLEQVGFQVIKRINVDQADMKRAFRDFRDQLNNLGSGAVGLFYYAGHGLQVNGHNYLVPISARIDRESDVDIEAVSADTVLSAMNDAGNGFNFVVLDACRNNPFTRSFRSAPSGGLARMDAPTGTLISYATAPGDVAADGEGKNSPFSEALAQAILLPDIAVEQMLKQVRINVHDKTKGRQTPWESSSLIGDFYFNPKAPLARLKQSEPTSPDEKLWLAIANSTTKSDFESFLSRYPKSEFALLAKNRLNSFAPEAKSLPWHQRLGDVYEGQLQSPAKTGSDKIITRLTLENGTLKGNYSVFDESGETRGQLDKFKITGPNQGQFRWRDSFGEGDLRLSFDSDLKSFQGTWQPDGYPDLHGSWSGKR